jgi:hypothetical protein
MATGWQVSTFIPVLLSPALPAEECTPRAGNRHYQLLPSLLPGAKQDAVAFQDWFAKTRWAQERTPVFALLDREANHINIRRRST